MAKVSDTFLKIRIWAKIILLALVVIYTLLFVLLNSEPVPLWLFFGVTRETNMIVALIGAFLLGALLAVLVRMVFKTFTQIRVSRERERSQRMEREIADMRTKASRLQTRE